MTGRHQLNDNWRLTDNGSLLVVSRKGKYDRWNIVGQFIGRVRPAIGDPGFNYCGTNPISFPRFVKEHLNHWLKSKSYEWKLPKIYTINEWSGINYNRIK